MAAPKQRAVPRSKRPTRSPARSPEKTPRRRNRLTTEAAFVAAAAGEFAKHGYEAATTKAIAARAGYAEALIQKYFHGKEGLLLAVIKAKGGTQTELAAFLDRPLCQSLEEEAHETLTRMVEVFGRRAAGLRVVLSRALVDRNFRQEFGRVTTRTFLRQRLAERFTSHRQAGRFDLDQEPSLAAEMLASLAFQTGFVQPELLGVKPAEVARQVAGFAKAFGRAFTPA